MNVCLLEVAEHILVTMILKLVVFQPYHALNCVYDVSNFQKINAKVIK